MRRVAWWNCCIGCTRYSFSVLTLQEGTFQISIIPKPEGIPPTPPKRRDKPSFSTVNIQSIAPYRLPGIGHYG